MPRIIKNYTELKWSGRIRELLQRGPRFAWYRARWHLKPKFHIVGSFPTHVDLEASSACDLHCVMCYHIKPTFKQGLMSFELFKRAIDECARYRLPSIKLNYRGEPLLNPAIVDMVKYAKNKGIMEVQFNTNATLLTPEMSKRIIEAGLDRIIFSLDGVDKRTVEAIRVGIDYDQVVSNIEAFLEIKGPRPKPFTRIQMVRQEANEDQVEKFKATWQDKIDTVGVLYADSRNCPAESALERVPCTDLWKRIFVLFDGTVTMCCYDFNEAMPLGNILETPLAEIWRGEKLNRIRAIHQRRRLNDIGVCRRCPGPATYVRR